MKNILSIVMVLVLVSGTSFASRLNEPSPAAGAGVMRKGATFKVFYKAATLSDVKVSIYNSNDELVFKEILKKVDGFARPYNFSTLPEGTYTIEISDGRSTITETVNHGNPVARRHAHVTNLGQDGKFLLMVPNKTPDIITVSIFDENHNLLYSGREVIDGDFAKVYNLKSESNKPLFQITDSKGNIKLVND
ncbi:MAG TPA: hypothetical protein VD816_03200 [Ohtaekwangia sp.]|nr:hypothetical protein [Ohtaekwangia sp.]